MSAAKKFLPIGLFLIAAGIYWHTASLGIWAHQDPVEMDTTAYLRTALEIRQTGGVLGHLANCWNGVYTEATQHPLYPLFISGFAERNFDFFVRAKMFTAWTGFIFLFAFWTVVHRSAGKLEAFIALFLVLFSATFIHLSTMVACESLFTIFFILFLFCAAQGFEKKGYWIAAGASASLAFLSKSLGILTLPIFLFPALWICRGKWAQLFRRKEFWGFFAVFILIALPLLIRNVRVYGHPLYSDSSAVLWLDRWHDYMAPDIHTNPPTLLSYWKAHGFSGMLKVFLEGLIVRDPKMLIDGLKPFAFWRHPLDPSTLKGYYAQTVPWQALWALFLVVLGILGMRLKKSEPLTVMSAWTLVIFLVFVGWYSKIFPGAPPTRLIYPVLFLIFMYAAVCICRIPRRAVWIGVATLFVFYLSALRLNFDWKTADLKNSFKVATLDLLQMKILKAKSRPGQKVLVSSTLQEYLFYWKDEISGDTEAWPMFKDLDEMKSYFEQNRVTFVFIDLSTVAYRLNIFGEFFEIGKGRGMRLKKALPEGMALVPKDPRIPPVFEMAEIR